MINPAWDSNLENKLKLSRLSKVNRYEISHMKVIFYWMCPPQIKSEREFNAEWGLVKYFNIEFYLDIFTCLWTGSVL